MGRSKTGPLIYMVLCMVLSFALLYNRSPEFEVKPKTPLDQVLSEVPGWAVDGEIPLDREIVQALDLDDYVFRTYSKGGAHVSLYIGLYRTAKKVGEAHSPLVCFPGQGWEISKPEAMQLETAGGTIHFESMTATKGMHRELLLYWYQSRGKTSRGTLLQKIYIFLEGLNGGQTDNAFVRVSIPVEKIETEKQRIAAMDFMRSFYPAFRAHMTL